jgi:2Fe-2S ferredoxin
MPGIVLATASGRFAVTAADLRPEGPCSEPAGDGDATVLDAVRRAGLPLGQSCRGEGVCRSCAVDVLEGAEHLGPPSPLERRFGFSGARRLACQARVPADATATVAHPAWGRPPPAEPAVPAAAPDATLEP